jgi:hypothetical protein
VLVALKDTGFTVESAGSLFCASTCLILSSCSHRLLVVVALGACGIVITNWIVFRVSVKVGSVYEPLRIGARPAPEPRRTIARAVIIESRLFVALFARGRSGGTA